MRRDWGRGAVVALAAGLLLLGSAGARAQLPDSAPDLTAYSNAVTALVATLSATNFANFNAEFEEVRRTTVALDEELFRFRGRCRAALAASGSTEDPMFAALTDAGFSDYRRGVSLIDGLMLDWARYIENNGHLLELTRTALTNALESTVRSVQALDEGWQRLRKPDLPASLEVSVRAPKRAAHGELVEVALQVWNAGDLPATNVHYRLRDARGRLEPPLPPVGLGELAPGVEQEHALLLRMPDTGSAAGYGVAVGCDSSSASSLSFRIVLEGP
jgi:hypothetical protein